MCEFQRKQICDVDGIFRMPPSGYMAAYLNIAYDLYVLGHHSALQNEVLRRLKLKDQFQCARYELFVAATFIRAGFDICYENEKDGTCTHPEFVATHRVTRIEIDVEAKSKHRPGVLGYPGSFVAPQTCDVARLLKSAVRKFRERPFIVFLDLNLLPSTNELGLQGRFE